MWAESGPPSSESDSEQEPGTSVSVFMRFGVATSWATVARIVWIVVVSSVAASFAPNVASATALDRASRSACTQP
jgi:hypothetical protein